MSARHVGDVIASEQGCGEHRPYAEMCTILLLRHASVANLEHVGVIPMSGARVGLQSVHQVEDLGDAVSAPVLFAVPAILNISGRAPEVADRSGPQPRFRGSPFTDTEDDRSSDFGKRVAHQCVGGLAVLPGQCAAPVFLQVINAPGRHTASHPDTRGRCCLGGLAQVFVPASV